MYPMALRGLGFGEDDFLVEVFTTDPTMEDLGNATESILLICISSYRSGSLGGELVLRHHPWVLVKVGWACFIS